LTALIETLTVWAADTINSIDTLHFAALSPVKNLQCCVS